MKKRKINYADWQNEIIFWKKKELIRMFRGAIMLWDIITIEVID